ncbi:MAG: MBL fold metallo-hydrolase [Akkermansiaceae bacterium]|nr:MBL fold metallo-hydrolase [Akkermansiaceae bacterium]
MQPDIIPLEDEPCDVIAKAMHGLELTTRRLAAMTGLSERDIQSALRGDCDEEILCKLAAALHLSAPALIGLPDYRPTVSCPDGLTHFVSPFGHAGVNAYVITRGRHAMVFDTGTDAVPVTRFLTDRAMEIDALHITHRHHDHTASIPDFGKIRIVYPEDCAHGQILLHTSQHRLTALDVSGHLPTAKAYLYEGLTQPVCILGDSIFAGSMGKTPNITSYQRALQTAREHILTLPDDTVLCPGHGPLTTVKDEREHNPFLNVV